MRKRLISLLLVFCMIFSLLPTSALAVETTQQTTAEAGENPFKDIKESDWCYDAVQYARVNGFFNGTSPTAFSPDGTMTRGMFVTVLGRMAGVDPADYTGETGFTDVPAGQWYAPYIGTASTYGVISGVGGGRFNPYGTITRQEAASMVARAARLCGMDTGLGEVEIRNTLAQFGDYMTVAAWAKESVAFCYRADILDQSDLEVAPAAAIRRGEIAQMLYNLLSSAKLL